MSKRARHSRSHVLISGCVMAIMLMFTAYAQDASRITSPVIGSLEMPSVTPDQAEQYLSSRSVPATTPIPVGDTADSAPAAKLNVEATLGHDLPQGETTEYGFKRADFATASANLADAEKKRQSQPLGAASLAERPATAILTEEPPVLGGGQQ